MNANGNAKRIGKVSQPLKQNPYIPTRTAGNINSKAVFLIFSNIIILILIRLRLFVSLSKDAVFELACMNLKLFFLLEECTDCQMVLILIYRVILQLEQVILV
tara:strand:+ start:652 stop:960 length:309 start_codon:yes stop_codon:yes gene_type:complete